MLCRALILLAALLAGPAHAAETDPPAPGVVTGVYTGVMPCAKCEGVRYRLHLRPDRAYVLETEALGAEAAPEGVSAVLGVWSESADGLTLVLRQPGEPPMLYAIPRAGVLSRLDGEGRPLEPKVAHELKRVTGVEPFQPLLRLQGMYNYMADAGRFRECLSRATFTVAMEGDNVALERGYLALSKVPNEPMLVTVDARIAARPSTEGDRLEDALVVEKFLGAWPGETCGDPLATADLAGTYWRLTRLGDRPVQVQPEFGEPHMVLNTKTSEVSGFAGCNRFMGGYRRDGDALAFGRVAATMMACEGRMDQEQDFLQALAAAATFRVTGEHLELYDKGGAMVARFQAREDN